MKHSGKESRADIVIAGAGFVGLALGAALARAGLDVVLCDPALSGEAPRDPRASTLVAGARHLFEALGAWDALAPQAQAVDRMEISDARLAEVMRPVMLTFGGDAGTGEPVAHVAPNGAIRDVLFATAKAAGVTFIASAISGMETSGARALARLADGSEISASLLVGAEGANSPLRKLAKIKTQGWRYDQTAIVTTIALEHDHDGVAVQHFLEGGPFALLPLPGKRASVVWAERRLDAERLYALPDGEFRAALQERAGWRFGEIALDGPRGMRPLALQVAKSFVGSRLALVGDAAHVTHPIAGQGLNMGLRDVAALAEVVADAARLGGEIGAHHVLDRYERWRRFDTMLMLAAMDGLLKLFSLRSSPARLVRDAGMGVFDRMPGLKDNVMRAAAGLSGDVPRLLRGEQL
jgi:2-octaprenyl-6-methoxyphenol hydroxylase